LGLFNVDEELREAEKHSLGEEQMNEERTGGSVCVSPYTHTYTHTSNLWKRIFCHGIQRLIFPFKSVCVCVMGRVSVRGKNTQFVQSKIHYSTSMDVIYSFGFCFHVIPESHVLCCHGLIVSIV